MSKDNLYELSNELAKIGDEISEAGGEINDEMEKKLDALSLSFDAKIEQITRWSLSLNGRVDALDAELTRLTARKKATANLIDRLKAYMKLCMEQAGKTKLEYNSFSVSIQKNPASCEIKDEKAIPASFLTIIPEQKVVDKKLVLEALKKGHEVPGAELMTNRTHLRVR